MAPANHLAAEDTSRTAPSSVPLLSTGTTVIGETLHYPTNGPAHVTAAIVTLPPGSRTVLHKHGVPLFAYVLEGEITVDYSDRGKSLIGRATLSWRPWTRRTSAPMPGRSQCAF
jgi:quercetin dioxygenase-like cupin family protein